MKKISLLSVFSFALIVLLAGCAKDGATGPQGAQGPAGPAGAAGPQGTQGPAGSANVMYSTWIADSTLRWDDTTIASVPYYIHHLAAASITPGIIDSGAIMVYGRDTMGVVSPMPITIYNDGTSQNYDLYKALVKTGDVALLHTSLVDSRFRRPDFSRHLSFRYIIIPGGTKATGGRISSGSAAGYTISQLKGMTYDQLVALLKIAR